MQIRFAFALVLLACCSCASPSQSLRSHLSSLTEPDAIDCGLVPLSSEQRANAVSCASAASFSGSPYYVAFQLQGIDSQVWEGVASKGNGKTQLVRFDSDPSGGRRVFKRARLVVLPCASPTISGQPPNAVACGVGR
jgi:hypothetical protein